MKNVILSAVCAAFFVAGTSPGALAAPKLPPFYEAVTKLKAEGKLGQIIKKEKIATSIKGAQAWRIAYISSDVSDRRTISTGLIVAPVGKAPAEGRPIVAWAHGTTGTAQNCGPSQVTDPTAPLNQYFLVGGNSWTDYGLPNVEEFIAAGYVVAATDYQGLGGGGRHQYAVGATNGRDLINAARAASSMKESGAGKKTVLYGWSQGGGAVIAAAGLRDYMNQKGASADNLQYLGFVAMAPDDLAAVVPQPIADEASAGKVMAGLVSSNSANVFDFAHLAMNLWGTQAAFPNLKLSDVFTDEGVKVLDNVISNKCVHVLSDTLNYAYGDKYKDLVKSQPDNALAWARAFVAGSVPPVTPVAPVIIYWGTKDTIVPPVMHEIYQKQMCARGGNVARIQLAGEQTHFTTPPLSAPLYLPWVKDRIAGVPLANACEAK